MAISTFLSRSKILRKPYIKFHNAVVACLNQLGIVESLVKSNAFYYRVWSNHITLFRLLKTGVDDVPQMAQYVIFGALDDSLQLKKAIFNLFVLVKSFNSERASTLSSFAGRCGRLAIPDAPSGRAQQIKSKVDQFANQCTELSMLVRKEFVPSSASSWPRMGKGSYSEEERHGANHCPQKPYRDTKCLRHGNKGHDETTCWSTPLDMDSRSVTFDFAGSNSNTKGTV